MRIDKQRGFSVIELLVVVAIVLILGGMIVPRIVTILDSQRLQLTAQAYAGLLQEARARAVQDNQIYQVLSGAQNGVSVAFVDLNGDSLYNPQGLNGSSPEPAVQLPNPIIITATNAPQGNQGFDTVRPLNVVPMNLATNPPMVNSAGAASPGIAFNERGLPCQRTVVNGPCSNPSVVLPVAGPPPVVTPVAWVTYFRYSRRAGQGFDWAAVSVSPAGRIKTWKFQMDANGGSWQ